MPEYAAQEKISRALLPKNGPVIDERLSEDEKYVKMFEAVQKEITTHKLADLTASLEQGDTSGLYSVVYDFLLKNFASILPNGRAINETTKRCIDDMTGYGFLNKYFAMKDLIEEININAWNAIEVRWCDGRRELIPEHFQSPEHATEIIKRILRGTHKYLDENILCEVSYIGKSTRIATVVTPIADAEVGVGASIRFIHSAVYDINALVENSTMTPEIATTLQTFLRHGVSICVCGSTGSGKTTVCNALLESIPDATRVITLEGGTREFDLIRYDDEGNVKNNRLHLQTRPHKDANLNIDLQQLLDLVLKFDPDIVIVGEMVSEEAFIAAETARTGHTVMTTIHANNAFDAYYRMYSLGIRKYQINEQTMLKFMVDAFPVIVYTKQYPDGQRRVQSVLESHYNNETHQVEFNELYHYHVQDNQTTDGVVTTVGNWTHDNTVSDRLRETMLDNGATADEVSQL